MRRAHHPISQILDELVTEFHLLAKGKVVTPLHHHLDQLTQLCLDANRVVRHVQMPDVTDNGQNHAFDTGHSQILGGLVCLAVEHIFHNQDNVIDELRVHLVYDNLPLLVEKLVHDALNLIKQNWIESGTHLVAHQVLHVPLYQRAKFLVVANQQSQQIVDKLRDRTILHLLSRVHVVLLVRVVCLLRVGIQ